MGIIPHTNRMTEPNPSPLSHLPPALRAAAAKLPPGQQHTVLELPAEGQGHNAGLIAVAAICYRMGVSFADTVAHLSEIYASDRPDHRTAPHRAASRIWEGEGELPPGDDDGEDAGGTPDMKEEMLLRFRRTPTSTLVEESPHEVKIKPAAIIEALFEPDEIVNIQNTRFEVGTLVKVKDIREKFPPAELSTYKFLNPSTFKKVEGVPNPLDKDKKIATRCNANVKARPYMVLEMDSKDDALIERFTTFALELAKFVPLALAVHTGGKSVHFWYDARDAKPADVSAVFALACLHGADKAMAVKSQIARMPNVSASEEGRGAQRVLYYDPDKENYPNTDGGWDIRGFEKLIQQAQQLSYYYLGDGSSKYYGQANADAWIAFNRTSLQKQLVRQGFRDAKTDGEMLSPVDEIISGVEMDKSIEVALKGASGRHAGYYEENGFRFLVLKSPTFIKPRAGGWPTIKGFLEHMLDYDEQGAQLGVFYGWLASSMRDLRNGGRRRALFSPAQMLHIIGPADSGKSLLLKFILPACFGGRSADCDELFSDKGASFNSDIFQSELLYLDDSDVLQADYKFRAKFGERIKSYTVGAGGSYHQKFGDKVPIPPWWRFVRMMNDEPHTIATLPPLEAGIADKLIFLMARKMDGGPIDKSKPGWFEPVRDAMISELPAFIQYLLEVHRIPRHLQDPAKRYSVLSFHSSDVIRAVSEDSPEAYLIHRFRTDLFTRLFLSDPFDDHGNTPRQWKGEAASLFEVISETGTHTAKARFQKMFPSPRVLAGALRKLQDSNPGLATYAPGFYLQKSKRNGRNLWILDPAGLPVHNSEIPMDDAGIDESDCF